MPPKKKKKGEEIEEADLPPWKSLNIKFNWNTCVKTKNLIQEQIDSFEKEYFS